MDAIGFIMILSIAVPAILAILIALFKDDILSEQDEPEPWNWV